jgi:DOPA 4,5-dioxygenase
MLNSEIARLLPPGFARDFDAHFYYGPEDRSVAERVRARAARELRSMPVFVGELRDATVGPHPKAMFEINFPRRFLGEALLWIMDHRQGLTVLVHRVTGDDARDHSQGAIWFGSPLLLDASKFDSTRSMAQKAPD